MNNTDLPIIEIREHLLDAAARQKRLIVTAPTGSGKSTQIPQMLLDGGLLGDGQVVILQPRRLPTRMLASWVAQQRRVRLGDEVGYQIRFDNFTSEKTRIRYVTEGVLLRQMLLDPALRGVRAVVFDEFHERHLYGDITLARALQLQETTRPDLLIIVMSATLDVGAVQKYLAPCQTLSSEGRAFPVTVEYLAKPIVSAASDRRYADEPIWEAAVRELRRLLTQFPEGDALVFMPGAYEISRTVQESRAMLGGGFVVLPLHGELPPTEQDAAVARYSQRKIVVSTNVAETSLTIDGVRIVVDSGLARIPRYDPFRGINTLLIERISRASADQRAGRAGRTAPGHCLRLWTQREHEARPAQELPEVKRLDLSEVVLTLKASGVEDIHNFHWLQPPDRRSLERAESLLLDLGAVSLSGSARAARAATDASSVAHANDSREAGESAREARALPTEVTDLGRRMLAFPLHPRYSRMLLAAQEGGCVRAVALIAALTQGRELLLRKQGRQVEESRGELLGEESESDFFILMRAWRYAQRNGYNVERCRRLGIHAQSARQVEPLLEQFLDIARREGLDVSDKPVSSDAVQRCVLAGFADHLARRLDGGTLRCELVHGRRGVLARESAVKTPLFVAAEVREVQSGTGKDRELNVVLSLATAVREEWLRELFPSDFKETTEVVYDAAQRRVVAERRKMFRDVVLESARADEVPADEAARILAEEVSKGNLVLTNWDDAVEQWIVRVNRLREWMPELGLPAFAETERRTAIERICHDALSYKEIKERPVWPAVKSLLTREQQDWVERFAPERITLPRNMRAAKSDKLRSVKVVYSADGLPTVSVRIQDLFDVRQGFFVADGRVPVVIQILAPNNRPVQVTQNLAVFWKETYPKVKQELQRKYPKHEWR
jgi:ATP-dependent helicase HrpB